MENDIFEAWKKNTLATFPGNDYDRGVLEEFLKKFSYTSEGVTKTANTNYGEITYTIRQHESGIFKRPCPEYIISFEWNGEKKTFTMLNDNADNIEYCITNIICYGHT